MKLACICCTYLRPTELANAIESFVRQDYPADQRELIILDDAGQYPPLSGQGWRIISSPVRFRTLGEKRNASAALAASDSDAYCVWDDDDVYLPWHLSAAAAALQTGADYTIPTELLTFNQSRRLERKSNQSLFHGAWSFTRQAFEKVHGYPFMQSGQDQELLKRFKAAKLKRADPIEHDPRPSYIYRWFDRPTNYHISAPGGRYSYEKLARRPMQPVDNITPAWERDWLELYEKANTMSGDQKRDMSYRKYLDFEPTHIMEIGAGMPWACRSKPYWGKCRVDLIEPNPNFCAKLRPAVAKFPEVTLHEVAIAPEAGNVAFYRFGHSSYLAELPGRRKPKSQRELDTHRIKVAAVPLDSIDDGTVDVALIDVETAEWYCLQTMVSRPRLLVLEMFRPNPKYQHPHRAEIEAWIESEGYYLAGRGDNDAFFLLRE